MDELENEYEKSFYKELYQLGDKNQWIVVDVTTEKLYLRKRLEVWNEDALVYLRDHKNEHLPQVKTFWKEEDGTLTLIEKYVQGETLSEHLARRDLSEKKKKEAVLGVLDALSFLHHAIPPIIHRDVKPDNIMIAESGAVFLVDYDAAKVHRDGEKRDTVLLGTEGSAAPEQYGFAQSDVRTDLYAVGTLIQALFPEKAELSTVVGKATRMDPKDRYQSAEELREAFLSAFVLDDLIETTAGAAEPEVRSRTQSDGTDPDHKRWKTRNRLGILIALLLAVIGVQIILAVVFYPKIMGNGKAETTEEVQSAEAEPVAAESAENAANSITDVVANETAVKEQSAESPDVILAPEVVEQGYTIYDGYATYGLVIHNPNKEYALKNVHVYTTVKGTDGSVLDTNDARIRFIAAGDTICFGDGDMLSWKETKGKTLEIEVFHNKEDVLLQSGSEVLYMTDLPVMNVSCRDNYGTTEWTGEIKNQSQVDLDEVCITGLLRLNGKIVGGWFLFEENLMAGSTKAFQRSLYHRDIEYDTCDLYALQWTKNTFFE